MDDAPTHAVNIGEHRSTTEMLARETNTPIETVEEIYSAEVAELEQTARIKTYVGVIATSRTRIILAKRSADNS